MNETPVRKRASEMLLTLSEERRRRIQTPLIQLANNWEAVDIEENLYRVIETGPVQASTVLDFDNNASLSDIFLSFVSIPLLQAIWDAGGESRWTYTSGGHKSIINRGVMPLKTLYQFYAIHVRIIGHQEGPKESAGVKNPLRKNLLKEAEYFRAAFPDHPPPNKDILETLSARFLITSDFYELLSRQFQQHVVDLGQIVAGDEKLLKYTGKTDDVRSVPTKPDKIGLWFYELMAKLPNETPYLVHIKLWRTEKQTRESSPVHLAVSDWCDVVNRHGERPRNINSILVFDSYYMTKASAQVCRDKGVMFLGSAKANNFNNLTALVAPKVTQKGNWAGFYNIDTYDMFVHKWEKNDDLGKKYCFTNAFKKVRRTRGFDHVVPGYDLYKMTFNACDEFNRLLHHRKWPHRYGAGKRCGDEGHHNKFAMADILQNTFNAYSLKAGPDRAAMCFKLKCIALANELYERSLHL